MSEYNVWSYICLQHIPAEQIETTQLHIQLQAFAASKASGSLLLSFNDIACVSGRVFNCEVASDSVGS